MRMTPIADPTGRQLRLASADGRVTAHLTQVGASLRGLTVGGVELVPTYPLGTPAPAASGIVLVPWPNRVRDGVWTQRGETRQLAISEPRFGNASHGLLRFTAYEIAAQGTDAATLAATVFPQTGYPFQLDTTVTYALTASGIAVTHTVTNVGADDAPVALGTHPFFCIGDVPTADLTIHIDAGFTFALDERLLPTAQVPLDPAIDLRTPRRLREVQLDTAYGGLARDEGGRVHGVLQAPDGGRLDVWAGEGFDYLQAFTTDRYPGRELAVAIEPMTAPADALNSGEALRWLAPGEGWKLHWGVDYFPAAAE